MIAATMITKFYYWLVVPNLTYKHSAQDCIAAHEGDLHIDNLAAHTTLNTYKPMELNIEKSLQLMTKRGIILLVTVFL